MKLACASTTFDSQLASGDLTQLEWVDLCAREVLADGIVCDVRHFPRLDTDYLAQIKKMAVDLGLTIAALWSEKLFDGDSDAIREVFATADMLSAPLLCAPLPAETSGSWPDVLERLTLVASVAKALNVTVALRNRAGSFAAGDQDLKRVAKEADSAWVRFGPEFANLDAASDATTLLSRTVIAWHVHHTGEIESDEANAVDRWLQRFQAFRGFLVLDVNGSPPVSAVRAAFEKWRTLAATQTLSNAL
ncbi:MAG: hypothetical protein JOZ38_01055 [Candidatus Eremiobacteraeota bacterium]|nr:hypothetical protein [Candidatus Eremiobacteraeota bacterium]